MHRVGGAPSRTKGLHPPTVKGRQKNVGENMSSRPTGIFLNCWTHWERMTQKTQSSRSVSTKSGSCFCSCICCWPVSNAWSLRQKTPVSAVSQFFLRQWSPSWRPFRLHTNKRKSAGLSSEPVDVCQTFPVQSGAGCETTRSFRYASTDSGFCHYRGICHWPVKPQAGLF